MYRRKLKASRCFREIAVTNSQLPEKSGGFFLKPKKGVKDMPPITIELILQKLAAITPSEIEELERWYQEQRPEA